ncbi:unnamed protein product [Laminaria digitata]
MFSRQSRCTSSASFDIVQPTSCTSTQSRLRTLQQHYLMFSDFGPELNCFYARQCAASGLPRPSKRTKMLYIPLQYLLALTSKGCMFYRLHPLLLVFVGVR